MYRSTFRAARDGEGASYVAIVNEHQLRWPMLDEVFEAALRGAASTSAKRGASFLDPVLAGLSDGPGDPTGWSTFGGEA